MIKKKDKKYSRAQLDRTVVSDWQPLFGRLTEVIDWGLDIADKLAREYPEDREAIENVREFAHGWLSGRRAEVPVKDLLTTIAILFSAIELDLGIDSVSLLAPLNTMMETPSRLPALLRCPGAPDRSEPTVVIRRFPGRRNASASVFTHLAAA